MLAFGDRVDRLTLDSGTATSDLVIFGIPAFTAALGWAIVSYIITGEFFVQVQSIYGSAAQEKLLSHKTVSGRVLYEIHAISALGPLVPILLVASAAVAFRKRDPRVLAPITVLGGALGFDMVSYMGNGIQDYLRYWIVVLPLGIFLLGSLAAALQTQRPRPVNEMTPKTPSQGRTYWALGGAFLLALIVMVPTTLQLGLGCSIPGLGSKSLPKFGFIFKAHPSRNDLKFPDAYPAALALGDYFSSKHLPNGSVVVDNSTGCIPMMIATSNQPKLFVIPNDRDFQRILADPITFHAKYIMEPDPAGAAVSAPNLSYPSLWRTGAGFTKLVHKFPAGGRSPRFPACLRSSVIPTQTSSGSTSRRNGERPGGCHAPSAGSGPGVSPSTLAGTSLPLRVEQQFTWSSVMRRKRRPHAHKQLAYPPNGA